MELTCYLPPRLLDEYQPLALLQDRGWRQTLLLRHRRTGASRSSASVLPTSKVNCRMSTSCSGSWPDPAFPKASRSFRKMAGPICCGSMCPARRCWTMRRNADLCRPARSGTSVWKSAPFSGGSTGRTRRSSTGTSSRKISSAPPRGSCVPDRLRHLPAGLRPGACRDTQVLGTPASAPAGAVRLPADRRPVRRLRPGRTAPRAGRRNALPGPGHGAAGAPAGDSALHPLRARGPLSGRRRRGAGAAASAAGLLGPSLRPSDRRIDGGGTGPPSSLPPVIADAVTAYQIRQDGRCRRNP